jgi:peroxiredoxin Q/BCP
VESVLGGGRKQHAASEQSDQADQDMARTHDACREQTKTRGVLAAKRRVGHLLAVILARVTTTERHLPQVGEPAPEFTLASTEDRDISLSDFKGKGGVVLYFYPRDDTPGCTAEACSFRDLRNLFREHGAEILGVSTDTVKSHKKFQQKYHLTFPLLADTDHGVADAYGVWQERKFMGRKYMGIARTTFVVDQNGTIKAVFPNVKVEGHADKVLEALRS